MIGKIILFIIGIVYLFIGVSFLLLNTSWWGQPVHPWVGYPVSLFGILCLVGALQISKKDRSKDASICPQCDAPYPIELVGTPCPQCGTRLENMEGFYDRHPELKEATKEADGNAPKE